MAQKLSKKRAVKQSSPRKNKIVDNPVFFLFAGLLLIVLPLVYSTQTIDPVLIPRLLGVNLILLLTASFVLRRTKIRLSIGLWVAMGTYVLITTISVFFAINIKEGFFDIVKSSTMLMLTFMLLVVFSKTRDFKSFLPTVVSISALLAVLIGFKELIEIAQQAQTPLMPDGRPWIYSVSGLMAHKNQFAISLMLMLPFSGFGMYHYNGLKKYFSMLAFVLLLALIVVLRTRSVWVATSVGFLFGFFLMLVFSKPIKIRQRLILRSIVSVVIVVLAVGVLIVFTGKENTSSISHLVKTIPDPYSASNINRFKIWQVSKDMIAEHPMMGVGAGNWKLNSGNYFKDYHFDQDTFNWLRPHNDYLWVWAEKGIFGIVSFLAIFTIALFYVFRILKSKAGKDDKIFTIFLASGLIAYMIVSMFTFPLERINQQVYLALMLAAILALYSKTDVGRSVIVKPKTIMLFVVLFSAIFIWYSFSLLKMELKVKQARVWQSVGNMPAMLKAYEEIPVTFKTLDADAAPLGWYGGVANQSMGNYQDAILCYEEARLAHPNHIKSLNNLGLCYLETGNYNKAIETFMHTLSIQPSYLEATINLASTYYKMDDYKAAWLTIVKIPEHRRYDRLNEFMKNIARKEGLIHKSEFSLESAGFSGNPLDKYQYRIVKNIDWKRTVQRKAQQSGISFDEQLGKDALFMATIEDFDNFLAWNGIAYFEANIKTDSAWLDRVAKNAVKHGNSLQKEIRMNAVSVMESEHKELYQKNRLIQGFLKDIAADSKWTSNIEAYARNKGVEPEIMKDAYAGFLAETTLKGLNPYEAKIDRQLRLIKKDSEWMALIKAKAKKQQKTINEMLRSEAIYLIERGE